MSRAIRLAAGLACAGLASTELACAGGARPAAAPAPASSGTPTIASRTAGLVRHAGFLPVYVDAAKGKALVELPGDSTRVLLFLTQATGLGSNPVGVDRGADGASYVARFDRAGDRVLLVYENWNYRSVSGDSAHLRTVRESCGSTDTTAAPCPSRLAISPLPVPISSTRRPARGRPSAYSSTV